MPSLAYLKHAAERIKEAEEILRCSNEIAKAAKIAREAGLMNDPVQQKQEPMPRIIHPQTKEELRKFWKVTADW